MIEGDYYLGIQENDTILLAEYLWNKYTHTKFTSVIKEYILNQAQPYFSYEKLKEILLELREEISNEKPIQFTRRRNYKQTLRDVIIYSDPD